MERKWWHDKVAYQIYPRSFQDTNGDGIGDLRGIISRLDYLKALGIDIIWISPIYKSPFVDQGYDIEDYQRIDPVFGAMEDFDELLAGAHERGMYIIMDLVINHCSDRHEWFQKALRDPEGEYGDYFYFRKGRDGGPPSNYRSYFGGSAWERVEGTDYYYLHMFAREQPDLNWENPRVLHELYSMINWWLDKGLDGFRVDAIINIKKDPEFRSFPADGPDGLAGCWRMVEAVDGVGDMLEELKRNTFARYDAFTAGEVFNMKPEELEEFIGSRGHFSTMFDFSAHKLTYGEHGWYDSRPVSFEAFREVICRAQLEAQPYGFLANIIENHDEPRGVCTYLPPELQNETGAKLLGTVSILLRGIPFIFQGQEIGMRNCPMESIDEYDDISTKNEYRLALDAGCSEAEALAACYHRSRDNARTPLQWSAEPNAGFTVGVPWLKVNPNYREINVAEQQGRQDSVLNYYRRLIALRKSSDWGEVFTYGSFVPALENEEKIFAYQRRYGGRSVLVAANFGMAARRVALPEGTGRRVLLNNLPEAGLSGEELLLLSGQAVVLG